MSASPGRHAALTVIVGLGLFALSGPIRYLAPGRATESAQASTDLRDPDDGQDLVSRGGWYRFDGRIAPDASFSARTESDPPVAEAPMEVWINACAAGRPCEYQVELRWVQDPAPGMPGESVPGPWMAAESRAVPEVNPKDGFARPHLVRVERADERGRLVPLPETRASFGAEISVPEGPGHLEFRFYEIGSSREPVLVRGWDYWARRGL